MSLDIIEVTISMEQFREHYKKFLWSSKTGKEFLTLALMPNREPEKNFGQEYSLKFNTTRDQRESGMKAPYCGNGKIRKARATAEQSAPPPRAERPKQVTPPENNIDPIDEIDDIPF